MAVVTQALQLTVGVEKERCIFISGKKEDQLLLSYTSKGFSEKFFKIRFKDQTGERLYEVDGQAMDQLTHFFDKTEEVHVCFVSMDRKKKTIDFRFKVISPDSKHYMTGYDVRGLEDRIYMVEAKLNELSESFDKSKGLGLQHDTAIGKSKWELTKWQAIKFLCLISFSAVQIFFVMNYFSTGRPKVQIRL